MSVDFEGVLRVLAEQRVKYILVGGAAAIVHGSAKLTQDIDVVYERSPQNLERLVKAFAEYEPYLRGAPPGLPFRWDAETLQRGLNFTLATTIGAVDLLGEIPGGGVYAQLLPESVEVEVFGAKCRCLSMRQLIRAKRAAGRPKDLEALAELEALDEESSHNAE